MCVKYDTRARLLLRARTKGWTQDQIAKALECSQPMASDYLSGESRPNDRRRTLAERVFRIPVGDWRTPEEGGPHVSTRGAQHGSPARRGQENRGAA